MYVDDLVVAGTVDAVESVKAIMIGKYKMKDLGKIFLILGCEVLYDEATGDYSMNQRHYVIDICKKYLQLGGARVQTPMSDETLTKEMSPTTDQQKLEMTKISYRPVATGSRADIAFAVTCCAKCSINPGLAHWYALLRILTYLEETKGYELVYRRQQREVEFGCYAERRHQRGFQTISRILSIYRRDRIGPHTSSYLCLY